MRARGARVTDIATVVVAADDLQVARNRTIAHEFGHAVTVDICNGLTVPVIR